jgi:2-methylcitrate dehydratase PrpD
MMGAVVKPVTHRVAEFALGTTWEGLPADVRRESARAWLNWVGCAVGGAATPAMDAAVVGLLSMGAGNVPVLGRVERVSMTDSAFLGSLAASAQTYDDTHLATITHPTGPVASALLATAHQLESIGKPVDGNRLLTALAIGIEIECRVSCAIATGGGNFGWYMTGLSGGIGAAAAVGRILGLSHEQMVYALGLAASQAGGLRAAHGSMAITFVPGIAARDGVVAAYLAAADYSCSDIAIDGKNGLLQVLTGATDGSLISDDLGSRYEMLNNAYKPYPCGIVIHPAIDACLHLVREQGVDYRKIARVDLRVYPDALNLCWRKLPDNALDALVSLFHWVGVALVRGSAGVREGEVASVMDPDVRAIQERTEAVADPALANNQAVVRVTLADGTMHEWMTRNAIGSVTNPMTDAQLATKFYDLVAPILGEHRSGALLNKCENMHQVLGIGEILQLGVLSGEGE